MKLETFISLKTPLARRRILELLNQGKIVVNGKVATDLMREIRPKTDKIQLDKKMMTQDIPAFVYYKFNKPKGVLSTLGDPQNRRNLDEFVKKLPQFVFPVGRLDRLTTGLLLFTNDGEFSNHLCHPQFHVTKCYRVTVGKKLTKNDVARFQKPMILEDGPFSFTKCEWLEPTVMMVNVEEGRNRIVRRACAHLGYEVIKLKRLAIGAVELGALKEGEFKKMNSKEVDGFR